MTFRSAAWAKTLPFISFLLLEAEGFSPEGFSVFDHSLPYIKHISDSPSKIKK